jgi:aminopeptidase
VFNYLDRYADVFISSGLNLKENDSVLVFIDRKHSDFLECIISRIKALHITDITVLLEDQEAEFKHYASGSDKKYCWITEEQFQKIEDMVHRHVKFLVVRSTEFGLFESLDIKQQRLRARYYYEDFARLYYYIQANLVGYCLGAFPNQRWAKLMFPHLEDQTALKALWESMSRAIYLKDNNMDPVLAWRHRASTLSKRRDALNTHKFDALSVRGQGTHLVLQLPSNHLWQGGYLVSPDGREYIPNIPTEEVFTTPSKFGVDGVLMVRQPLYFKGRMIEEYCLTFKSGVCVSVESPDKSFEIEFSEYIKTYAGGNYLGEIALVTNDSGVKLQNTFYYDMVYDENASCHFAFGNSYKNTLAGGEYMSEEDFLANGGNVSLLHMDFMYDSQNMDIFGAKEGHETLIMSKGVWRLSDE